MGSIVHYIYWTKRQRKIEKRVVGRDGRRYKSDEYNKLESDVQELKRLEKKITDDDYIKYLTYFNCYV